MQAAASGAQHGFDRHHAQTVGGGDEMPRAYQPYHRSTLVLEALELVSPYLVIALSSLMEGGSALSMLAVLPPIDSSKNRSQGPSGLSANPWRPVLPRRMDGCWRPFATPKSKGTKPSSWAAAFFPKTHKNRTPNQGTTAGSAHNSNQLKGYTRFAQIPVLSCLAEVQKLVITFCLSFLGLTAETAADEICTRCGIRQAMGLRKGASGCSLPLTLPLPCCHP